MVITVIDLFFVGVVLVAFALGLRAGVCALIIIRPLCDRLFELASYNVAGHAMTYGVVMNIVVICAMIFNIRAMRQSTPSMLRNIWLPFLLVCAVAVLYSPVQIDALRKLLTYVSFYSMFMFSFLLVKSERHVMFFMKSLIISSVLPVLYGLFQIVSGADWFMGSRISSTFSHPKIFAFYLVAVIGVIFFLLAAEHIRISGRFRLMLNLYLIPLLIVLIMTKTRNAWIGCLVLFFVYGLIYDKRALVFVFIAPVLALAVPAVSDRIMDLASDTDYIGGPAVVLNAYAWREMLWENSFTYIWQQPILGYGLDSFHFYSPMFFPAEPDGTYAHNVYIQVLFETGFIGLIAFVWIFWRCFAWLMRHVQLDKRGVMMAAAIIGTYLVACCSDNLLEYLSYQWSFWFAFGVVCSHIARHPSRAGSLRKRAQFAGKTRLTGGELGEMGPRPEF
jgi:O-antigen ligase